MFLQGLGDWSETNKHRIAELLFSTNKGIGLSAWRFNIGAGVNRQTIRDFNRYRGPIVTADGVVVAQSVPAKGGDQYKFQRQYPLGDEFGNVTGYYTYSFGSTQAMSSGRWVDVTLATSRNPALAEGVQDLDLASFSAHVCNGLPAYARPVFLRIQRELDTTGTFKLVKVVENLREQIIALGGEIRFQQRVTDGKIEPRPPHIAAGRRAFLDRHGRPQRLRVLLNDDGVGAVG